MCPAQGDFGLVLCYPDCQDFIVVNRKLQSSLICLNLRTTPAHHFMPLARRHLLGAGFQQLSECDEWALQPGDFEMNVYDTQPGCVGGAREEFVFASRLDNLASSFCALWALLDTCSEPSSLLDESGIHMVALFDIGEQGSDSVQGAGPQIMLQAMTRITRWLA
ncbi:unnamed protein product [Sphagnum troendelagicum]|uniref:Uncharacterized protein n=1 Tax=Sphagnum troendelagicum TaxID=128251 RepID=A0ABP0V0D8_9BRYO